MKVRGLETTQVRCAEVIEVIEMTVRGLEVIGRGQRHRGHRGEA